MLQVNVKGGTNAGRRKPLADRPADWICGNCGAALRYHWRVCPVCHEGTRPDLQEKK